MTTTTRVRWRGPRPSRCGDTARGVALGIPIAVRVYATGNRGASAWSATVEWDDGRIDVRRGHAGGMRAALAAVTAIVEARRWDEMTEGERRNA